MSYWSRSLRSLAIAVLAAMAAGCVSGPFSSLIGPPDWIAQRPGDTADTVFFVAAGSGEDRREAAQAAAIDLHRQLNQALGVDISMVTSAEARSTRDSYEVAVIEQVTQEGSGRIEGLRIQDRYIDDRNAGATIYLLGAYDRRSFEAEQETRRAILRDREATYLEPENRGDVAVDEGRVLDAMRHYVTAAVAAEKATGEGVRSASSAMERSIQKAIETAGGLRIEPVSGPAATRVGERPERPIVFRVVGFDSRGISGATVEISFAERRGDRSVIRRVTVVSGGDGRVVFAFPPVATVGPIQVTARVDAALVEELLKALPPSLDAQRSALARTLASARGTLTFQGMSIAREVPTAIIVVDTDIAGSPMAEGRTAEGIQSVLSQAGFRLSATRVDTDAFLRQPASQRGGYLQGVVNGEIRRAIYGTAWISSFQDDQGYLVKVSASVTAIDLNTGEILASVTSVKNAMNSTAEMAITTAFLQLGRQVGEQLAAELP